MKRVRTILLLALCALSLVTTGALWRAHGLAQEYAAELEAAWQIVGDVARQVGCQGALAGADKLADAIQDVASCAAQRAVIVPRIHHLEPTLEPHVEALR